MSRWIDPRLDQEHPSWGGLDPDAGARVFGDVTAYTGSSLETVAARYWHHHETADADAQLRVAAATEESAVSAYYASTPNYLYELSYWEASHDKQGWFRVVAKACERYRLRRVLDFGGGIGGLTLALRARGIQCDYLDVRGETSTYAAWRFAKHAPDVAMFDAAQGSPPGAYDAIIAWDVLEHLFDLESALGRIVRSLQADGWFLSKSTFTHGDDHDEPIHLAQHARYADVAAFHELLSRSGFRYVGQLKPDHLSRLLRHCGFRSAVTGIRIVPRLKHGGNFLVHRLAAVTRI